MHAAIAGTPAGGDVRLGYGHSTDGQSAMLTVESHAGGLAPLRPVHVFDDLESGQNGGVRAHANLSLIVARGLIGLHRGTIHLRRSEDGGQAALIRLPLNGAAPQ
jgi:K+-sensing histidine kinase KdpD